jgi:hypothetical protein
MVFAKILPNEWDKLEFGFLESRAIEDIAAYLVISVIIVSGRNALYA